jgi:thiazole synthase
MSDSSERPLPEDKPLEIAGRVYQSRLLVGTGKYRDMAETGHAIEASGAEIVTFAVRRTNLGQNPDEPSLLCRYILVFWCIVVQRQEVISTV